METARRRVSEGSGSSQQKSSFWSPFWGISAEGRWLCGQSCLTSSDCVAFLIRFALELFLFFFKKMQRDLESVWKHFSSLAWLPRHLTVTLEALAWSTPYLQDVFQRSALLRSAVGREVNLGLLDHCWMDFLILERWPAFFFISGLWVGPGLCLHQLSSLFSETHCLLVESNFNWNGWRYKSFSVHQNGTAEPSSNH